MEIASDVHHMLARVFSPGQWVRRQVSRCTIFSLLTKSSRRGVRAGFAFLLFWIPFSLVESGSTYVARSQRLTMVRTSNCPVTRPNGGRPVGTAKADPMYFGNG